MKNYLTILILTFSLIQVSCVQEGSGGRRAKSSSSSSTTDSAGNPNGSQIGGNNAVGDNTGSSSSALITSKTELIHFVDPFDGTYKAKLTLPKNFTGLLFLSGLNITSLSDRIVSVKFNFGKDLEPVIIGATVGRAPGITPQTDVEVLILDLKEHPFENIRLLYDLYDYNDYDEKGGAPLDPTQDARNPGLFCRGLNIENDHTFIDTNANSICDASDDQCLYAYAKVRDVGLFYESGVTTLPFSPSEPHVALNGVDYSSETFASNIKKCLPDSGNTTFFQSILGVTFGGDPLVGVTKFDTTGGDCTGPESCYTYNGPYLSVDEARWEVSGNAIYSFLNVTDDKPKGLFGGSLGTAPTRGINSFLFPRASKMALNSGIEYLGDASAFPALGLRSSSVLSVASDTLWMDGCNMRATHFDTVSGEGISSCNVTATIEILAKDRNGTETIISSSKELKLQLIRPSLTDYRGEEVLYSALTTCSNSNSCGASECCFNKRCWSKELVSQCLEDVPVVGGHSVGETCVSDYECSSFCCDGSTRVCRPHINTDSQQAFCSKVPGQQCVAKEWCRQENVPNCFVVKTGVDSIGASTCALRCYNVPTFGDCKNGACFPPAIPPVPIFDPANPDCSTAIDPPSL